MRFRAVDVAAATGGRLVGPDVLLDGVSFDSRTTLPGQLFVPLIAGRDGHEYIEVASERGAAAYLTSVGARGGTAVEVADTLQALMALATAMRPLFAGPVVGITGSVGKTSTKDLARAALSASRRTWANERSFNNEQGLPTTLLNTPDDTEVLVVEMGMRGFGEIAALCDIARPSIGVVTRVAEAHSDRVGGIEGVARAKAELVQALPVAGTAILNADDDRVRRMVSLTDASVLLYGEAPDADVRAVDVRLDDMARASFRAVTPWGEVDVRLAVSGRHMVANAVAALAVVGAVGADLDLGAVALAAAGLSAMRMEVVRAASGVLVLNDAYNANPTSMRAALDALAALPAVRRVAVLGVMAEISDASAEHASIAAYARSLGVEIVAVGTALYRVAPTDDPVAVLGSLAGGDAVLVKGSRVVGLERVVTQLLL
jgi:UDP-N-acetylmuramoyl-tripeptide--D-alanyl-D-alanine ligase